VTGNQTITELYLISVYIHVTSVQFYGLLNDLLSVLDYITWVEIWLVDDKFERIWKKVVMTQWRYYPGISWDGLRNAITLMTVTLLGAIQNRHLL